MISSLIAISLLSPFGETEPAARPNIVLIMIDDLGWMDLACQGNPAVETPHIDRLASQGMRFTDAYAAAPVCSPTRAAIMTGEAPARLRITTHIPDGPRFQPADAALLSAATGDHLPLEKVTIAERLRGAGYATAFLGKWHLSGRSRQGDEGRGDERYAPEHQGFDINLGGGCYGGPPSYFSPYGLYNLRADKPGEHLPDRLASEAVAFMREHRQEPFFLCLWNYTVHWPMQAPQHLLAKYAKHQGPGLNDNRYGAMIEAMDQAVGRVLAEVDRLGLGEKTLVVFTSDNGGYSGVADNRPLREGKGYLYEGGIRVPFLARWTGKIPAGSQSAAPIISTDLFPTFLEAAGLSPDEQTPCDGESLLPLLCQRGDLRRDALYFHYPNYAFHKQNRLGSAIRCGKFKLIENFDDGSVELYDLSQDLGEKTDLAVRLPRQAARLRAKLQTWRRETGAAMPKRIAGEDVR